jgi:hypothetical protein
MHLKQLSEDFDGYVILLYQTLLSIPYLCIKPSSLYHTSVYHIKPSSLYHTSVLNPHLYTTLLYTILKPPNFCFKPSYPPMQRLQLHCEKLQESEKRAQVGVMS